MSNTGKKATGGERRKYERREVATHALLEPLGVRPGSRAYTEVEVGDAGRTGVMLRLDQEVSVGSSWRMWLVHRGEPFTSTPIVVRYCGRNAEGKWQAGAQFMLEPFFLARMLGTTEEDVMRMDDVASEDRFTASELVA